MKWVVFISVGGLLVLGFLLTTLYHTPARPAGKQQVALVVYCPAGLRQAVDPVARDYEQTYGVGIQLQYGGSGTLLNNVRVTRRGDLFIAADQSYIAIAREQGLLAEVIPLVRQTPVVVVRSGNSAKVSGLADLFAANLKVSMASPDAASIGSVVKKVLQKQGRWTALEAQVRKNGVFKSTVNDVANDVKLGAVDAGIVWDSTARQYPGLEIVPSPEFKEAEQEAAVGILQASSSPVEALRFARYLSARDKGLLEFTRQYYSVMEGDEWAEVPELKFFSGAMLRPAIARTLSQFEEREGVRITTVYNGCGILTAQMKAGERPDAYFACDVSFMDSVSNLYDRSVAISANDLVILVAKGNPHGIQTPEDLQQPGLRLGLGHPEKSAMGWQTKILLTALNQYEAVLKNLKLDSATGDFLVNQIRTGSLDAVIAWRSNAAWVGEHLEVIGIDHPQAHATQPYAIGKSTKYPHLMQRLQEALVSAESKQRFEAAGLKWSVSPNE